MYEGGVTPVLECLLVTLGDISRPAGTGKLTNGKTGGSDVRADRQGLADARGGELAPAYELREGGKRSPILIWNNPNMSKATGRNTSRVVLEIVGE